ncbi:hypothetical protein H0H81_009102 [Sphagnurus paluster]|uniref:Protein SDA1 n=1 Tax=Sphagnurus paluster TaxID=117069 RepID=A0A9P7K5S4_9AGAR|nr:hypothetical protein H0H81_009102 [Sphagnurus paluster]
MGRGVLLTANLPQLQNLIKRDPTGYKEEFLQQWNHYNSIREIFKIHPDEQAQHFGELVTFISQVATCYPKETAEFPLQIISLLLEQLLKCLFPILPRTTSSTLRTFIRKTILSDIRTANIRSKNHKLNRAVQAMMFGMVERGIEGEVIGDKGKVRASNYGPTTDRTAHSGEEAMWAVILTKELWRKGIWTDAKPVAIIALGCFHPVTKVQSASLHFFLGSDEEKTDSDDEEDDDVDIRALHHRREINKKTRSGDKKLQKILNAAKKKRHNKPVTAANFPALQLLNDPQTFAEKLYDILNRYDKRFSLDHKILLMQLLSRVMGSHKLCVLGFYTYIIKYLAHRQLRVPAILVALAQSVHDLTPPDTVTPVVRKLAQEFVHPGVGSEVIAAGLNAIREVSRRQPWCMEEDLLSDLIEYRKSRDKAVTAASRGLLQLFREVNPGMLKRRERGKDASMGLTSGTKPLPFGCSADAAVDIEGLSLLEDHWKKLREEDGVFLGEDEEDEGGWDGWDIESDSSDEESDEGWQDVPDDNRDLILSDSEDEEPNAKSLQPEAPPRISTLATTKILTPADFALLNDLRIQEASKVVENGGGSHAKRKLATLEANKKLQQIPDQENSFISENDILGPRKKAKSDYAERMASIQKGREGREKFKSNKGKINKEVASSSTNREKARNKPIMMILSSGAVRGKKKASLREKQQRLRKHIEKAKKMRH